MTSRPLFRQAGSSFSRVRKISLSRSCRSRILTSRTRRNFVAPLVIVFFFWGREDCLMLVLAGCSPFDSHCNHTRSNLSRSEEKHRLIVTWVETPRPLLRSCRMMKCGVVARGTKPIRLSGALGTCRQRIRARPKVCVLLVALPIRHPCYVGTLKLPYLANWRTFPWRRSAAVLYVLLRLVRGLRN